MSRSAPRIVKFDIAAVEERIDSPRPQDRVLGDPKRVTRTEFVSTSREVDAGTWRAEPGVWRFAFAESRDQFVHVLSGRIRLGDEAGTLTEIGPGESAVIPSGFRGTWEVVEAVTMRYVLIERRVPKPPRRPGEHP